MKRADQVREAESKRKINSMQQRELESLRFKDNFENMVNLKDQRFLHNCNIVEKHLALSILNQEKKQFMQNFNDKYRAKMAKEQIMMKEERGNSSAYTLVQKKHMNTGTFAPDLVTWTKKDFMKLMKDKKEES